MGGIDLDTVADDLYGLPPSEFTSRRDALAAEARQGRDRPLAAEIKKLRRPTTGAWLANLLARERRDQVAQLLDLGAAMRQAQAALATDDLRRLSQDRRLALAELSTEARDIAAHHGQPVSDAVVGEVEATLEAALADAAAADALRAGRLTTGLRYSGLGLVEGLSDDGARAGAEATAPAREKPAGEKPAKDKAAGPKAGKGAPLDGSRPAEAERALPGAQAALAEAEWDAGQKRRRLEELQEERDRYRAQVSEIEQQLKRLREAEDGAEHKVGAAQEALDAAENDARAARDALARVRAALKRGGSSP
jgi:hypothetical protein